MVASRAVHRLEGSPEEFPDELKNRIANLSRMAAQLSISSANESSPPPQPPTPPPSSGAIAPQVPVVPPPHVVPSETSAHYPTYDHPLKRGPSDLDEHRSVKAMKREPQEFSLPNLAGPLPLDPSAAFPATAAIPSSHAIPPVAQSRPVSRPPSPTNFAAAVAQYAMRPTTIYHPCPPVASAPAVTPLSAGLPQAVPLAGPQAFPGGRAAWSEPTGVQSRHHHSLSAGAIISPLQGMPVCSLHTLHPLQDHQLLTGYFKQPTPTMQMPPVIVNPTIVSGPSTPVSVHPPPHVRTARSGSLSSLSFEASNYFVFPEKIAEVPVPPGARSARSSVVGTNWYFGDNSSSPANTSEEPTTARNSPSDDDDDDSSSDSDDEVDPASKSTTHLVRITSILPMITDKF